MVFEISIRQAIMGNMLYRFLVKNLKILSSVSFI